MSLLLVFFVKIRLQLVVIAFVLAAPAALSATTTVEFLAPASPWNASERQAIFYLKVAGGNVSNFHCWISALTNERGDPASRDAFECSGPESMSAGSIGQLSIKVSTNSTLKRGSYNATLQVLGTDPAGAAVSQTASFKAVFPAVSLKIGETDAIRVRIIRPFPLWTVKAVIPLTLRAPSDTVPHLIPRAANAQLYIQDGDVKAVVPDGYLTARFCDRKLAEKNDPTRKSKDGPKCTDPSSAVTNSETSAVDGKDFEIEASVPPGVQKASTTLRLQSSEFATDSETPITLLVKDRWVWAAIVVFLGQLLSYRVNNWVTIGRQRKLNKIELEDLESRLVAFLVGRPDLEMRREIADVYGLMDRATQSNWLGDTEVAKKAIKDACDKLDQFTSSPPAPQPSSDPPSIVMLRKQRAYPGVPIHFVVANRDPKWTSTSTYTWEWSGQRPTAKEALKRVFTGAEQKPAKPLSKEELDNQDWRLLFKAQDLRDITTPFWKPGQYTVRLTVDSAQVAVRSFRLDKDQSVGFLSRIAISDSLILLLAVVFAAILSYLAIDKLETFGSISDYALAFLGGFGLNATTSGFSAVISRFQGRPPS